MKNFKKIISAAIVVLMMIVMSVTAMAEESTTHTATIKVTNISDRDEATAVSIYQIAYVNTESNSIEIVDWAKSAYNKDLKPNFDATTLEASRQAANPSAVQTTVSEHGADVEFTGLAAGVYMIKVTGRTVQYNPMVAVAYTTDANGNYVVEKNVVEIKAKGSSNTVEKTDDDGLVRTGQDVNFTLKSTVPYMANKTNTEYKMFDKATNLSAPKNVKVTVGDKEMAFTFDEGVAKGDAVLYTMDLSSLVASGNNDKYAGMTVVVTYTATVFGPNGFVNTAYDSTYEFDNNGEPKNPPTVVGYPADITLTKYAEDDKTVLKGAEFEVSKEGKVLNFIKVSEGVYKYSEVEIEGTTTTTIVAPEGTVQITGLDEGKYHFAETKAPEGYSINPAGVDVIIENLSAELTNNNAPLTDAQKAVLSQKASIKDTKLSSLPFTGGMGTTLFTVLGVALMALASALYFATKKKGSVN